MRQHQPRGKEEDDLKRMISQIPPNQGARAAERPEPVRPMGVVPDQKAKSWVELLQRYSKLPNLSKLGQNNGRRPVPLAHPRTHLVSRRLIPEAVAQLVADYEAGVSSTALMKKYCLGKGTVLKALREAGVTRPQNKLSAGQLDEAVKLYAAGWSLVRIGERLGFDQSTLWLRFKEMGVPMRKAWERGAS